MALLLVILPSLAAATPPAGDPAAAAARAVRVHLSVDEPALRQSLIDRLWHLMPCPAGATDECSVVEWDGLDGPCAAEAPARQGLDVCLRTRRTAEAQVSLTATSAAAWGASVPFSGVFDAWTGLPPKAFQAWLETAVVRPRAQPVGDVIELVGPGTVAFLTPDAASSAPRLPEDPRALPQRLSVTAQGATAQAIFRYAACAGPVLRQVNLARPGRLWPSCTPEQSATLVIQATTATARAPVLVRVLDAEGLVVGEWLRTGAEEFTVAVTAGRAYTASCEAANAYPYRARLPAVVGSLPIACAPVPQGEVVRVRSVEDGVALYLDHAVNGGAGTPIHPCDGDSVVVGDGAPEVPTLSSGRTYWFRASPGPHVLRAWIWGRRAESLEEWSRTFVAGAGPQPIDLSIVFGRAPQFAALPSENGPIEISVVSPPPSAQSRWLRRGELLTGGLLVVGAVIWGVSQARLDASERRLAEGLVKQSDGEATRYSEATRRDVGIGLTVGAASGLAGLLIWDLGSSR